MKAFESRRSDEWLWYARLFKSRSLAMKFCASGKLRLNDKGVRKAHHGRPTGRWRADDRPGADAVQDPGWCRGPSSPSRTPLAASRSSRMPGTISGVVPRMKSPGDGSVEGRA